MKIDPQTIQKAQTGDSAAWAEIYDSFFRPLYRFIYYKTFQRETTEDLTSQTFLQAFEKIHTFQGKHFSAWLYQIARHLVIDYYRSHKQQRHIEDVWDLADQTDLLAQVDSRLTLEQLGSYLKELKPTQREILLLRVWDGLPYSEIAALQGKSEAACKMTFSRTLTQLKNHFEPALLLFLIFYPEL